MSVNSASSASGRHITRSNLSKWRIVTIAAAGFGCYAAMVICFCTLNLISLKRAFFPQAWVLYNDEDEHPQETSAINDVDALHALNKTTLTFTMNLVDLKSILL